MKYIGWALGEHALWSKYSNFDVAVHVPLIISIPIVMSDTDNYSTTSVDYTRYNAQITNNGKMENKIKSKYILDVGEIDVSNISTEYIRKSKENLFETYIQRGRNKSIRSSALHFKKRCRVTDVIVELVDIFPTIADLAGVPIPICQVNDTNDDRSRSKKNILIQKQIDPCVEGITLLPLIKNILKCQVRPYFLLHC